MFFRRPARATTAPLAPFALVACLALGAAAPTPAPADTILQYFESQWETIERRLPDVFMANYSALWVPPPGKGDTGGFSVGYDCFDRFHLGSRHDRTLYGTEQSFSRLSREMDTAGISLFIDLILNHNGFRDASTPDFVMFGDYPGFVVTLPNDVDGDFHGAFEGGDLNGRLAGLIDIAQEKNHQFIRHPAFEDAANIPNEAINPANRALYPDLDLPGAFGRHPFNTADPMAGDPVSENATGLLLRYCQWLVEVHGVDGFRIDAIKHVPTWFWNDFYDPTVFMVAGPNLAGNFHTPFSFGENFTSDFEVLGPFIRKDGFGNRDALDFPLFFKIRDIINAGGFGNLRDLEFASVDGIDGNFNDGSRGVMFASSHDQGGPDMDNVVYAHILTRTGFPLVYFNAKEFGDGRPFPLSGRGDALGGDFGDLIPRLVRLQRVYASGAHRTRWINEDYYVLERSDAVIAGISDRRDAGFMEVSIDTDFRNVTLTELSGNATNIAIDPTDEIRDTITIGADGRATFRIPHAASSMGFHGSPFVIYGPAAPRGTLTVSNATGEIPADPPTVPNGIRRMTPLTVVADDSIDVTLQIDQTGPHEDNALIKVDFGRDVDANPGLLITGGRFAGYEEFTGTHSPSVGGGTGTYSLSIDATGLEEGPHYISAIAFLPRPGGSPAIFADKRVVVYLDRVGPAVDLLFPPRTGANDVLSPGYEAVIGVDRTANSVHVLPDVPMGTSDEAIVAMIGDHSSAGKVDRLEWRWTWSGITTGLHSLTVVAFEETGNRSITRFENIHANLGDIHSGFVVRGF